MALFTPLFFRHHFLVGSRLASVTPHIFCIGDLNELFDKQARRRVPHRHGFGVESRGRPGFPFRHLARLLRASNGGWSGQARPER